MILRTKGWSYRKIAAAINVSEGTVYRICTGRTWPWLRENENA